MATPSTLRIPGPTSEAVGTAAPACGHPFVAGPLDRRRSRMQLVDDSGEIVSQLSQLAKPFPEQLIERVEGNDYVAHHIITQRLLSVVGPFDFKLVELVRGDVAGSPPNPEGKSNRARQGRPALSGVVVAAVYRLVCEVD